MIESIIKLQKLYFVEKDESGLNDISVVYIFPHWTEP